MPSKRVSPRSASPSSPGPSLGPVGTAFWLGLALSYGGGLLVARGRVEWPPTELLASAYTVAGCLALVGPILLHRRDAGSIGRGELIWLAGGLIIWVFDGAALARGETRSLTWSTPLAAQPMGLTILAVTLAAWRGRVGGANWSWTNVTGWGLGLFWMAMAAATLVPARTFGLVAR